jgi:hypothetical protein
MDPGMPCAIAADTKLETPEGPLTVKTVGASPTSVMTRTDEGTVRFAMTTDVHRVGEAQPVLRITLENGRALRVGPEQVLLTHELREVSARELRVGDELLNAFSFPVGYEYRTDDDQVRASNGAVKVARIEPAGDADLYSLKVARTGRFVFSSGVIGKAEG